LSPVGATQKLSPLQGFVTLFIFSTKLTPLPGLKEISLNISIAQQIKKLKAMQKIIFIFLLLLGFTQSLFAQTPQETALQWLHQHQDALAYRNQSNEDEGYIEESFRFLPDKIVERTARYDKDKQLLSSDEQDWLYRDFEPVDDISSLPIDTVNGGKLGLIRLMMTGPSLMIMNENGEYTGAISYPVFEIGFLIGDNVAKQKVLGAIKALIQLLPQKASPVSKYSDNIRRDFQLLEATINQQKFPFPATMGYRITAALKDMDRLTIYESRPHFVQEYTLLLHRLEKFTLLPDTTGYNQDALHFVLKMKDSVLVASAQKNHRTKYSKQPWAIFTLENPHLIAKTEVLLTNICRDNYNRKKWNEAKKLEETF
jgi:hypothetical protein